jgi:epoxyqueuosine reductase
VTPSPADVESLPAGAAWHAPPASALGAVPAAALTDQIRDAALDLGFIRVGFCPIEPFGGASLALGDWLAAGHHGEMDYLAAATRSEPHALLPGAKSLIVVALPYGRDAARDRVAGNVVPLTGLVARYARGADYHDVLRRRLRLLADRCAELAGRPVLARACVDTAPLLEREAARRSGVGFTAKSTMTIVPGFGSYVLLGELLLDVELAPTSPISAGCGGCRTCIDACPTSAFIDAYTLDARRCISYLTIELRGPIPRELRPLIGRWVFGCDVCQEVCPFNHSPKPRRSDPELVARRELCEPDLLRLLEITTADHRRLVRGSALHRVSRPRLQRNAAVALGNSRSPAAAPALSRSLSLNPSALVRGHAAWALGRIGTASALAALSDSRPWECAPDVVTEIDAALLDARAERS